MDLLNQFTKLFSQSGGGSCSLCGAAGSTKATCPLNPAAKNPNATKHNKQAKAGVKKAVAKKSPPKTIRGARSPELLEGCTKSQLKKYMSRKSPPFPANQCCGQVLVGNDGREYISKADKNGVCRWSLAK